MHLVYIDDSYEKPTEIFSALVVPANHWLDAFSIVKDWRKKIRVTDGIFLGAELHATNFVSGRGRISPRTVPKGRRCQIFRECLEMLANNDHLSLFNVVLSRRDWAFERLVNRINRTMREWDSQAVLICDEGNEAGYTKLLRKMSVHNPIPSQFGIWRDTGKTYRNIPLDRIIEDPFFRDSARSYFIQLADFCAYALLRREREIASKNRYDLHKAFKRLEPICFKAANRRDPFGVIR